MSIQDRSITEPETLLFEAHPPYKAATDKMMKLRDDLATAKARLLELDRADGLDVAIEIEAEQLLAGNAKPHKTMRLLEEEKKLRHTVKVLEAAIRLQDTAWGEAHVAACEKLASHHLASSKALWDSCYEAVQKAELALQALAECGAMLGRVVGSKTHPIPGVFSSSNIAFRDQRIIRQRFDATRATYVWQ